MRLSDNELAAILDQSRRNNARDDLTGMLLYSEGVFLQVLEGEEDAVDLAFARIQNDSRHHGLIIISRSRVAGRSFGEWSMGFARASQKELLELDGSNDFFAAGDSLRNLTSSRAKRLLERFRRTNP